MLFSTRKKRAERACDRCGRFLCPLCDLPLGARHLCPACLKLSSEKEALPELVHRRISWGRLSLLISLLPIFPPLWILWFVFFLTGPAAVVLAIYGWNKPPSLVHGQRHFAALCGLVLGIVQVAGIVYLFHTGWKGVMHRAL